MDYATWSLFVVGFLVGCGVSVALARKLRMVSGSSLVFWELVVAFMLGVALIFAIGNAWDTCAKSLGLCNRSSDTTVWNIVLLPTFMIPVFWLILVLQRKPRKKR